MDNPSLYQLFLFPIMFKTISFHHRANYSIKIKPQNIQPRRVNTIEHQFLPQQQRIEQRSGNIQGIGGQVDEGNVFSTDRFSIEYNQQSVKFSTGVWIQIAHQNGEPVPVKIQLWRIDVDYVENSVTHKIENPKEMKVSTEVVFLNLDLQDIHRQNSQYSYRKLVFPTNQYISSVDMAICHAKIGHKIDLKHISYDGNVAVQHQYWVNCCLSQKEIMQPQIFIRDVYRKAILQKIGCFNKVAHILRQKIKQYKNRVKKQRHSIKTNRHFDNIWVKREVPDLNYIIIPGQNFQLQGMDSGAPINNNPHRNIVWNLCTHYDCQARFLFQHITQQSFLIEMNTQAIFQRIIQVTVALAEIQTARIIACEQKRVQEYCTLNMQMRQNQPEQPVPDQIYTQYKENIKRHNFQLKHFSLQESKQPLLSVSGDTESGKSIDVQSTATILVHGFKGSQFDLSKIKCYLGLFLRFTHFHAVQTLGLGQGTNASLSKLGQLAGIQVNSYLQRHRDIKHVNVIGFSLGGVIARAMLRHIQGHQSKFNLLLTIGSPHLGIREVQSCIVRAGLLYMRRVAKVESIQDLNNQRTTDKRRFLQELANCQCINYFKWVILVGSHQDQYIPCYSSLGSYRGEDQTIKRLCGSFNQHREGIIRCNVKIEVQQSFLDKITRRKVHISMLQNDSFIKMLVLRFAHYFTHTRTFPQSSLLQRNTA